MHFEILAILCSGNFVVLIGLFAQQVRWQQSVNMKIAELEKHADSKEIHMGLDKKFQLFIPRVELDSRLKSIENILNTIYRRDL